MSASLFIGNLPYNASEGELRELFSTVGQLLSVYLPTERESGKLRGFAFIEYSEQAHAEEAIRRFDQHSYKGRPLRVTEARSRDERPRTTNQPRPLLNPSNQANSQRVSEPSPQSAKPMRNFGPDAAPRRRGKSERKVDRRPKQPMREVGRTQFFGGDDDDSYGDEVDGENFASRETDSEDNE
jgi:RNA recognition motif-containing protein